jgi:cytochrome c peroxidase
MRAVLIPLVVIATAALAACTASDSEPGWSEDQRKLIASLSLSKLPALPADPSNAVADDPRAAALGKALFFDTRLSGNGKVSCGTCHLPDRQFQDDLALARGAGTTARRTMPIAGTAYSPWLFWDGRKDSQWSQALGPLESTVEHNTTRAHVAEVVATHYAADYEALFGALPDLSGLPAEAAPAGSADAVAAWEALDEAVRDRLNRVFANAGKAIAAFERTITPERSRFDDFADALAAGEAAGDLLSDAERRGLRLFIGKASCTNCHNGPLLTDNFFHNTGVPAVAGLPEDTGRALGARQVMADEFNCLGRYSDAGPADCAELRYMSADGEELVRAFKPPSLRDVADRPPYMHSGQIASLSDVLAHYNAAPAAPEGHSELKPLAMSASELADLEAFLNSLKRSADER